MLTSLFRRLFHHLPPPENSDAQLGDLAPDSESADTLPRKISIQQPSVPIAEDIETSIVCIEAVLDRQQKIAGYQFLLQKAVHTRIRVQNRRVFHLYAEILIRNLVHAKIFKSLGQRSIFIEIPDSFLGHPCLTQLPAANTFFILKPVKDSNAPTQDYLLTRVRTLRKLGYRIGIPDPLVMPAYFHLLSEADLVSLQASQVEVEKGEKLISFIRRKAPQVSILAHDLSSIEDFNFCHEIGKDFFRCLAVGGLGRDSSHLAVFISELCRPSAHLHAHSVGTGHFTGFLFTFGSPSDDTIFDLCVRRKRYCFPCSYQCSHVIIAFQ